MDLHLKDKVVLTTGSRRGIGLACAKAFAAEGCRMVLSGRSTAALAETEATLLVSGATVVAHAADVTKPDQATEVANVAVAAFGGIDILIDNVGGGGGWPHIADSTDDDWRTVLEENLIDRADDAAGPTTHDRLRGHRRDQRRLDVGLDGTAHCCDHGSHVEDEFSLLVPLNVVPVVPMGVYHI